MDQNEKLMWDYYQAKFENDFALNFPRQNMLIEKIKKIIPRKSKILELGFGNGYLLKKISKEYDCYGADISEENVKKVQAQISDATISLVDTNSRLPYENNFFDCFIASEVLEHMNDKELDINIKEINRILKYGGYAFLTFPAEENLKSGRCFCPNCGHIFHRVGHKQTWSLLKIKEKFSDYKIVDISEYFNRFVGKTKIDNLMGKIMWLVQTSLNYFIKFPNKICRNRSYVVTLRKK